MKSRLRRLEFHEIQPSEGLDFIKSRSQEVSEFQKIQKLWNVFKKDKSSETWTSYRVAAMVEDHDRISVHGISFEPFRDTSKGVSMLEALMKPQAREPGSLVNPRGQEMQSWGSSWLDAVSVTPQSRAFM